MPLVEVFDDAQESDSILFEGVFDFLPRVGDIVSKDAGGFFDYYKVANVWHREEPVSGAFKACISVTLDD